MDGGSDTVTQKTEIPGYIEDRHKSILDFGDQLTGQPYTAYPGMRIAPFTADQTAGFDAARTAAGTNPGLGWGVAQGAAAGLQGYNPLQTGFGHGVASGVAADPNIRDVAANPITAAQLGRGSVRDVAAGSIPATDLGGYLNPYTDTVVNNAISDLDRSRRLAMNDVGDDAVAAGAWGGSGWGVAQGETNRAFADAVGRTSGELRAGGYDRAVAAAQTDLDRSLEAQGLNQGMDWNVGNLNTGLEQTTRQFNSEQDLRGQLANQQADVARAQTRLAAAGQMADSSTARNNAMLGQTSGLLGAADQMRTSGLARQARDLNGSNALLGIGGQQQAMDQANLDLAYQDFLAQRGYPMEQLSQRLALLRGSPTGSTTSTTQPGVSPFSQGLGFLSGTAGLYSLMSGKPLFGLLQ
ncbi:hypothetical protein [Azospirillum sp. ST 5-10]|uniref:hypothetical protein n=1 Tax=unclassified Azospirillum TaxID=2630922 RepID=UPI003F4A1BFC